MLSVNNPVIDTTTASNNKRRHCFVADYRITLPPSKIRKDTALRWFIYIAPLVSPPVATYPKQSPGAVIIVANSCSALILRGRHPKHVGSWVNLVYSGSEPGLVRWHGCSCAPPINPPIFAARLDRPASKPLITAKVRHVFGLSSFSRIPISPSRPSIMSAEHDHHTPLSILSPSEHDGAIQKNIRCIKEYYPQVIPCLCDRYRGHACFIDGTILLALS